MHSPSDFGVEVNEFGSFGFDIGLGMEALELIKVFTFDEEEQKDESQAASSNFSNASSSSCSLCKKRF